MNSRGRCLVAAAVVAISGCQASGERPGFVLFPEMFQSVSYKAYDPNPVLARGQTLQLPPEGTVPLERAASAFGPGPEEAQRAGRELRNPVAVTAATLKRGQRVYESVCVVCHGPQGQGDGPIIGRFPNPPSLLAERARGMADGQVFHIITRGQGIMPSHAAQVLPDDRWRVIHHLRQLQGVLPRLGEGPPPAAAGATP